jgi:hypothetical protein
MTPKLQGLRERTEAELDRVSGGDSGKVGNGDKKVGAQSTRPNDGSGAYDIGTQDFHGPNH